MPLLKPRPANPTRQPEQILLVRSSELVVSGTSGGRRMGEPCFGKHESAKLRFVHVLRCETRAWVRSPIVEAGASQTNRATKQELGHEEK